VIPTWLVWSVVPPANLERICCASIIDAARAWAERQFAKGLVAQSGTEVLVRSAQDPFVPRSTTYQVAITLVNAPAFRARLVGVANEVVNGAPREIPRG